MRALQSGDSADRLSTSAIQHLDTRAMCHVETMRRGIRGDVVPAAFAADLPLRDEVIGALGEALPTASGDRKKGRRNVPAGKDLHCVDQTSMGSEWAQTAPH